MLTCVSDELHPKRVTIKKTIKKTELNFKTFFNLNFFCEYFVTNEISHFLVQHKILHFFTLNLTRLKKNVPTSKRFFFILNNPNS